MTLRPKCQNRIPRHHLIALDAQNQTHRGVFALTALEIIKHAPIHVHLPHILVCELAHLQIDQHKALEQVVVKHQINVEMVMLRGHSQLPRHKGKALAQLQQKGLKLVNDGRLQIGLMPALRLRQAHKVQKVQHIGVLDEASMGFSTNWPCMANSITPALS